MIKQIKTQEFNEVLNKNETVLVYFYATWCMPCKMLGQTMLEVDETLKGEFPIVKLDIDENIELAKQYGVMSVPTIFVFKHGAEAEKVSGFHTEDQIIELINKYK